jgi:predicted SAM-dependent methyltransferase
MKLNLGSCDNHAPGFVNVDICEPADQLADLSQPWPWPDASVEQIRAHDIFEHIPGVLIRVGKDCHGFVKEVIQANGKVFIMNEAYRVLKPGGTLELVVPTTDGRGAFQDPTHSSYWTPNDLFYYSHGDPHRERFGKHYGIVARFKVIRNEHRKYPDQVWKLHALLEKIKT